VDVAIVSSAGHGLSMKPSLLMHHHQPYSRDLQKNIFQVRETGSASLAALAALGRDISMSYADAIGTAAAKSKTRLTAIAAHGQTLFHEPPNTMQWLDPTIIAAALRCPVISDFRRADCAAGGQGAPLVPFADYLLFRHSGNSRVVLNIGGIANLTFLGAGESIGDVIAFDTGPGNCISDHLARQANPDGPGFDADGELASRGVVNRKLLAACLANRYFAEPPPRSTDGPAMIAIFESARRQVAPDEGLENLLHTACALTSSTIAGQVRTMPRRVDELIVSGGGVRNSALMRLLREQLPELPIVPTQELGIPGQAKEAIAFALLGAATLDCIASNVPSATGARMAVVLGSVTPSPEPRWQ
jgi:anhydro-N-acetylmuramic acid kinase